MNKKIGFLFFIIGILFVLNAIFGRYIVLPGYFQSLEAGISASQIPENVPLIKILRYLLWAFSFKFGIYFIIIGMFFIKKLKRIDKIIFSIIGLTYISIAYLNLSFNYSLFFGIGGGIITISSIIILWNIIDSKKKNNINGYSILNILGLFFIIMAVYNLCPFCGVKCFALEPEKMIRFGLQDTAISFANHIMLEFAIGFSLIAIHYLRINKKISLTTAST